MRLTRFTTNKDPKDAQLIYEQRIKDSLYIYEKYSHNFIKRDCPFCQSTQISDYDKFYDTYNIALCDSCGGIFVSPCPNDDALSEYYKNCDSNKLWTRLTEKRKDKKESAYIEDSRINSLIPIIEKVKEKPVKILEIGAGSGIVLEKLRNKFGSIVELTGIDLDNTSVETAQKKGLNVICADVREYSSEVEQYDIIIHFELIEHLIAPKDFIVASGKLLKLNGYMLFTTPNGDGLDNKAIGYNFKNRLIAHSIFPPMHLQSFNTKNIHHLLLSSGLKVKSIVTPGKLDVDIINIHDNSLIKEPFKSMPGLPEEIQVFIQNLISTLNCSSHMEVLAQK
jgi:2-polyprenyl-6-hydroxyphenyl methylase / 3-demethylubiquinone-9 3-methyltransferase